MASEQGALPSAHVLVKITAQLRDFVAQAIEFGGGRSAAFDLAEVGQFPLELFEFDFSDVFFGHGIIAACFHSALCGRQPLGW